MSSCYTRWYWADTTSYVMQRVWVAPLYATSYVTIPAVYGTREVYLPAVTHREPLALGELLTQSRQAASPAVAGAADVGGSAAAPAITIPLVGAGSSRTLSADGTAIDRGDEAAGPVSTFDANAHAPGSAGSSDGGLSGLAALLGLSALAGAAARTVTDVQEEDT